MMEIGSESHAMIANNIRVLSQELNEAIRQAAEKGLQIQITTTGILDIKGKATSYPAVAVRVLTEVQ